MFTTLLVRSISVSSTFKPYYTGSNPERCANIQAAPGGFQSCNEINGAYFLLSLQLVPINRQNAASIANIVRILIDNGFKQIANMRHGIYDWVKKNHPVTR
jgi:hypothetical protein